MQGKGAGMPRIDSTISLGSMLQAGALAITLTIWLVKNESATGVNARETSRLEAALATQAGDTQKQIDRGLARVEIALAELKEQIRSIPDISARLAQFEREARRGEERDAVQDQRLDALRDRMVAVGAEVETLKRASAVNLPGSSGPRPR